MPEFKKPPGPPVIYAVIENGHFIYASPAAETGFPKSMEVVNYVPEWEREEWRANYASIAEAGYQEEQAFEKALIAVQVLVAAIVAENEADVVELPEAAKAARDAVALAKELAPGAWIIKRDDG